MSPPFACSKRCHGYWSWGIIQWLRELTALTCSHTRCVFHSALLCTTNWNSLSSAGSLSISNRMNGDVQRGEPWRKNMKENKYGSTVQTVKQKFFFFFINRSWCQASVLWHHQLPLPVICNTSRHQKSPVASLSASCSVQTPRWPVRNHV